MMPLLSPCGLARRLAGSLTLATLLLSGCTTALFRARSHDEGIEVQELASDPEDGVRLVREFTAPWGTNFTTLESVALVTGLNRTGSDPPPSAQRQTLISEMQTHDVKSPNYILASPDTSLVLVRAFLPPGVRRGDRIDVEVRVPGRSETTSLRDGWLMQTRLREVAVLDNALRTGRVEALAEGPVIYDAAFDGTDDPVRQVRGRVLGGTTAMTSRKMGLMVRSENHSIRTSTLVAASINARFYTYDRSVKKGVATPKRDNYIELAVHPRYQDNLGRYMRVVRSIAIRESAAARVDRLERLKERLHDPSTAAGAALQLEAIGREANGVLQQGLRSPDPEVRFFAAEALAYLNDQSAAETLGQTARENHSLRWHAITALSAMQHASAHDELSRLLHVESAETRYAAFVALHSRNPMDSLVRGKLLDGLFMVHRVESHGSPLIHLSRSRRAEIVIFGQDVTLRPPTFLYAGDQIMLKGDDQGRIQVTRFVSQEDDQRIVCSPQLGEVIEAIVELGGGYADVIHFLQEAREANDLDARIVVDALPSGGRAYRRSTGEDASKEDRDAVQPGWTSPLPDLFKNPPSDGDEETDQDVRFDVAAPEPPARSWRSRLGSWFAGE